MKIEHCAYQVENPVEAAEWYSKHLGFTVKRAHKDRPWVRFLADDGDAVMLEFYNHPDVPVPDYAQQNPLIAHIAFKCDDLEGVRKHLVAAGATAVGDIITTVDGDNLLMLRDPWGLPIQFAKRVKPMI